MGLGYCIVLLYAAGPLDKLLSTPTGFPFIQIFLDATKSKAGATVMSLMITLIAIAATVAGVTSTSRTLWAFARDRATPFHGSLSRVNQRFGVPVWAIIVITILQMLLGLIYLGNTTAFNAVLSMAIIGMYLSYVIPIICMLFYGRRQLTQRGRFRLGTTLGVSCNIISILWIILVIVFSTFPTTMPVTAENMNYAVVVMAGWVLFGLVYYIVFGRFKFHVPIPDASIVSFDVK